MVHKVCKSCSSIGTHSALTPCQQYPSKAGCMLPITTMKLDRYHLSLMAGMCASDPVDASTDTVTPFS